MQTINLLKNVFFDKVFVYKYSERPNLLSEKIKENIPETIKNERFNQLTTYLILNRITRRITNIQFFPIDNIKLYLRMSQIFLRQNTKTSFFQSIEEMFTL